MFVTGGSPEQVGMLQTRISELEQQVEQQGAWDALQAELDSLKSENEELRSRVSEQVKS